MRFEIRHTSNGVILRVESEAPAAKWSDYHEQPTATTAPGHWADHFTCRCAHCGKLFEPPEPVVEIGMEGAQTIQKGLWLPDSAYADPRLLAPCPHCGGALTFNPLVVDNAI